MHTFLKKFPLLAVKGFFFASIILTFSGFCFVNAQELQNEDTPKPPAASSGDTSQPSEDSPKPSVSSSKDALNPSIELPPETDYQNSAERGSYENEPIFGQVPEWHYYDIFGNKLIDGYSLYKLSMSRNNSRNNIGAGSSLLLHPFLKKWLNGLVEVADLHESNGIQALIGDRIKSEFTPFTLNQSLFAGARVDAFYKQNSLTFLTNRISNTWNYGMLLDVDMGTTPSLTEDWLTGVHAVRNFGEIAALGGTFVNIHHEDSKKNSGNPFSGTDSDILTLAKGTYTGLSLYGLDFNLKNPKYLTYCEYLQSQEYLDGDFLPKPGTVATLNGRYDIFDKWRCGSELYTIGSRFQTNFNCPVHPVGDPAVGKYQYSLIEDNDDKDEYPENGQTKYPYFPVGDPDGTIPAAYDKDKNGLWDYEEDFLSYDADPVESKILFDRNNNGTPDAVENDAYPDYPYVPSYYLPGQNYWRFDDINNKWEKKTADTLALVHKGLAGFHLYSRYDIRPNLEVTVGGIFDRSQEKTFQPTYINGVQMGEVFDAEKASNLYFLVHYKKGIAIDKSLTIDNFFRKVQDNIPNHTQGFFLDHFNEKVNYYTIIDKLDYRDMFGDALRAEFTIFRNRGFNYSSVAKFEFQKHFPHIEFNYPDENISSLTLVNKCHYIFLLPFFKDMFLIPKYKNVWESNSSGAQLDSQNVQKANYRRNSMINAAYLTCEWKITDKTAITTGLQIKKFDDFLDNGENYWEPCFSIQLMVRDRYMGTALALTTGFSWYEYNYDYSGKHNPLNNPHRVVNTIDAHELFIKIHCGF